MTKKKTTSKKRVAKNTKPKKKTNLPPKNVVQEITTIEETKKDGSWIKTISVKYIKKLMCPALFSNKMLMVLASIPLVVFVLLILWAIFSHE